MILTHRMWMTGRLKSGMRLKNLSEKIRQNKTGLKKTFQERNVRKNYPERNVRKNMSGKICLKRNS